MKRRLTFHQRREWTWINQTFSLLRTCFSLHSQRCGGQLISERLWEGLYSHVEYKDREKSDPSFFSVLPCSWQSRARVNSGGKSRSWMEPEEWGSLMQRAPSPSIPALEKRVASCCCWAFFPGFNRESVKGAWTGRLNVRRESEEWKLKRKGRKQKGEGGWKREDTEFA